MPYGNSVDTRGTFLTYRSVVTVCRERAAISEKTSTKKHCEHLPYRRLLTKVQASRQAEQTTRDKETNGVDPGNLFGLRAALC